MRPLLAAVLVTAVIAALAAGCSDGNVGTNEAAVEIAEGSRVLIAEPGDDLALADGTVTVDFGTDVKVLAGSATISLADGGTLEVRERSEVEIGTRISLVAADVLVTSGKAPVVVEGAGSEFIVDGVAQISRDFAVSASSYQGSVAVRSAARELVVPALRQVAVASLGVVPTSPKPLDYDPGDPWDRRSEEAAIPRVAASSLRRSSWATSWRRRAPASPSRSAGPRAAPPGSTACYSPHWRTSHSSTSACSRRGCGQARPWLAPPSRSTAAPAPSPTGGRPSSASAAKVPDGAWLRWTSR